MTFVFSLHSIDKRRVRDPSVEENNVEARFLLIISLSYRDMFCAHTLFYDVSRCLAADASFISGC